MSKRLISTNKRKREVYIIAAIIGVLLLVAGVVIYQRVVSPMNELSEVSKELRIVYDNILRIGGDNVKSSYFRNECSYAYIGPYTKNISCGPSSKILTKTTLDLQIAKQTIEEAYKETGLIKKTEGTSGGKNIYFIFRSRISSVDCYISYSYREADQGWSYGLSCSKYVSGFLPGYVISD